MSDMTHPRSRADRIVDEVIDKYISIGTIDKILVDGIKKSIDLLPCSLETMTDSQIVDVLGRLIVLHYVASRHAQAQYEILDPQTKKLTEYVSKAIDRQH